MSVTIDHGVQTLVSDATGATVIRRIERVQSLWDGYGELVRLHLDSAAHSTVILKDVSPRVSAKEATLSHIRKCRSYDVETEFYRTVAGQTNPNCRVAKPLGIKTTNNRWLILLEDLDAAGFGSRRGRTTRDVRVCIRWLAAFHARFLGVAPIGLWPVGTYWHLETRLDELARIEAPKHEKEELQRVAPLLDQALQHSPFQTLVHGDAKPANFCFSSDGERVAAVDFQYVGGGCGMKDVAYLLYGSATPREVDFYLDEYFATLRIGLSAREDRMDIQALERNWRRLYPIACADFVRFLAGWAPGSYNQQGRTIIQAALKQLTSQ